jgi:hypothetical protein
MVMVVLYRIGRAVAAQARILPHLLQRQYFDGLQVILEVGCPEISLDCADLGAP